MKDKLTICRRCGSDACYEHKVQGLSVWNCMGCGFTTNEVMTEGSQLMIESEEVMPEFSINLFKSIKYISSLYSCFLYFMITIYSLNILMTTLSMHST
jgi:ribosomal protein L37E